ncbi:MAG: aldehyde dehydrogenase family protein [Candidatus Micrarchaeota archaeon]
MAQIKVVNPANSKVVGAIQPYGKKQVDSAVKKARTGFKEWAETDFSDKRKILLKYSSLLGKRKKELAESATAQMGKPITQSLGDAIDASQETKWFVNNAEKALASEKIDAKSTLAWEPVGVVACIKAWNFPIDLVSWSAVPALMAGNTIVFKHSELTPFSGRQLTALMHEAGVPENAFVLIEGAGETGRALVDSDVDCVSFTGSSKTGLEIAAKCGARLVKSVLELGGSSPAVVFGDADFDYAVQMVLASRFGNCGQACSSAKRLIVHSSIAEQFIDAVKEKAEALALGDPMDKRTAIGPLASFKQLKKLEKQVADAKRKKAKIILGGKRPQGKEFAKGAFFEPTLLTAPRNSAVWREETFGPVLAIRTFKAEREAIELANDTAYGLSAQVYTRDWEKGRRVASKIIAGSVFVNAQWAGVGKCPWFGVKQSGWGFEGMAYGFREFARPKHLFVNP